jgi:hypothetical protein
VNIEARARAWAWKRKRNGKGKRKQKAKALSVDGILLSSCLRNDSQSNHGDTRSGKSCYHFLTLVPTFLPLDFTLTLILTLHPPPHLERQEEGEGRV